MSTSYEFPEVDVLTAGALGEPGQRVFFLQLRSAQGTVSLRCEKQQVGALAEYLSELLEDLPQPEPAPGDLRLEEPVAAEWVVGALAVAYEEPSDRVLLVAEELVVEDDDAPDPDDGERGVLRARLTRGQVRAFIDHAREVVAAGRPPCRLCGRPLDPAGHVCPRTNGHGTH